MKPILTAVALLFLFVIPSRGDTLYTYTGNPLSVSADTPCGCELDGWVILSQPLTPAKVAVIPVDFSFTVAGKTINSKNAKTSTFNLAGDGTTITLWTVDLTRGNMEFWSQFAGSFFEATDIVIIGNTSASVQGNPGVWVDPPLGASAVATPEPATLALIGAGAGLLLFRKRRRSNSLNHPLTPRRA